MRLEQRLSTGAKTAGFQPNDTLVESQGEFRSLIVKRAATMLYENF